MKNYIQDRRTGLLLPKSLKKQRGFIIIPPAILTPYTDFIYSRVVSLAPFSFGTNGSTTFPDQKGVTWTANGNAQLTTTNPKWGSSALLLDGNGDYVTASTGAIWNFATVDFTVETWFLPASPSAAVECLFTTRASGAGTASGIIMTYTNTNNISATAWTSGGVAIVSLSSSSVSISTSIYNHIAFVRSGNNWYLCLNGSVAASASASGTVGNAQTVNIGRDPSNSGPRYMNGRIADFRATTTWGRYITTYPVPTAAFPNSGP